MTYSRSAIFLLVVLCLNCAGPASVTSAQTEAKVNVVRERVVCTGPCERPAIVFIHGIWGSEETWRNEQSGKTWPQLMLEDEYFKEFDIYRVDYETHFATFGTAPKGADIARALFRALRPTMSWYPRAHLIGHSMGGNLVRHMLVLVKDSTPSRPGFTPHDALRRYADGIFFLGTPLEGSGAAAFGKLLARTPTLTSLLPVDVNDYLNFLNQTWGGPACPANVSLDNVEGIQCKMELSQIPVRAYAACEMRGYKVLGIPTPLIIVSKKSATALVKEENAKCFDRDHRDLVKPLNTSDPVYVWIKARIPPP